MNDFLPAYNANQPQALVSLGAERKARPSLLPPQPANQQSASDRQGSSIQLGYRNAYQQQAYQQAQNNGARFYKMDSQLSHNSRKALNLYEENEQSPDRANLVAYIQLEA